MKKKKKLIVASIRGRVSKRMEEESLGVLKKGKEVIEVSKRGKKYSGGSKKGGKQ